MRAVQCDDVYEYLQEIYLYYLWIYQSDCMIITVGQLDFSLIIYAVHVRKYLILDGLAMQKRGHLHF